MKNLFRFIFILPLIWLFLYSKGEAYWACSSYWFAVIETNTWCTCLSWYGFSTDIFWKTTCVSMDTLCSNKYWYRSSYDSVEDSCKCWYWYIFWKSLLWDVQCVEWNTHCRKELWYNSSYNTSKNSCLCDEWYTIKDGKCVEKQNNVYSLLLELNTESREAKISFDTDGDDRFDDDFYYIKYSWCYSSDMKRYLWELLVVNLGTDLYLDAWDKLVLQNEWYDCDVTSRKKVSSEFTIYTCEEIFWSNSYEISDWKCWCDQWYEFSNSTCVEKKEDRVITYIPVLKSSDTELVKAVLRMYINGLTKFNIVEEFNPNWYLTREQASKFYVQFSTTNLWKTYDPNIVANFDDIYNADPSLQTFISLAYNFGLFKWSNWKFKPFDNLSKAQALAVAIRAKYWFQNETYSERYSQYFALAKTYWLIDGLGFEYSTLDSVDITRWEIAIILYRLANL